VAKTLNHDLAEKSVEWRICNRGLH